MERKKKKNKKEDSAVDQEVEADLTRPGPVTGQTTAAENDQRPRRKQRPEAVLINPGKSRSSGEILRALRSGLYPEELG